jgi:deoxyribonuclease V
LIAFVDVDYRAGGARAACVLVSSWSDAVPVSTFIVDLQSVEPYVPGSFYKRELPCLQSVLRLLPATPTTVVVDGYVWLSQDKRPGLGAHLHEALGGLPVIGVAKTNFKGLEGSDLLALVHRGQSAKPLFVTAVGLDLELAASSIASMHGEFRIPEILRITDNLARSTSPAPPSGDRE